MLKKRLSSKGDTIIEVLISLAVLSLAFSLSYAIATKSLQDTQDTQEHSQALEYLDAQFEALKYTLANQGLPATALSPGAVFCFNPIIDPAPGTLPFNVKQTDPCLISASGGFNYHIEINNMGQNVYNAVACWDGLNNNGTARATLQNAMTNCLSGKGSSLPGLESENLYYRIYS